MTSGLRILIADDDDGDRKHLRRLLKKGRSASVIVEACNNAEALSACAHHQFDCAFIDYMMPGQSGLESVSALHARQPHMQIVMVTGEGDEMIASEAIKRGAMDYMPKRKVTEEAISLIVKGALERASFQRRIDEARIELETFAGRLVHDLRSPLRSIKMYIEYVKESIAEGDTTAVESDLDRATRAADRMGNLIDTLFLYTRADAAVTFEPFSMDVVLDNARHNLDAVIAERDALVTADPLPEVMGHPALLMQLLQNLIANSVKYCEATPPKVHVSAKREADVWQFTVTDNGIGIAEEHRDQIFLPFERLHGDNKYTGTGLGLATCKRIVERHGGRIWCESADQGGSAFCFTLSPTDDFDEA